MQSDLNEHHLFIIFVSFLLSTDSVRYHNFKLKNSIG